MMTAMPWTANDITRAERKDDCLYLYSKRGTHRIQPKNEAVVRITYTERDAFSEREKPGVIRKEVWSGWEFREDADAVEYLASKLRIRVDKKSASFSYYDGNGCLLLREREKESRELEEFQSYVLAGEEGTVVEKVVTPDGTKEVIKEAARVQGEKLYHTRLYLEWQEDEALYGLGQHEEGFLNLRGQTVYLHQANRKIAVPVLVSNLGYGILTDTYSPMIFNDTAYGSYLYTEADDEMDFYFMNGGDMDGVVRQYRYLTGKVALLPKWAYGYVQSQERYETAGELIRIAKEYRDRGIGLDGIVLDWLSWGDNLWGPEGDASEAS